MRWQPLYPIVIAALAAMAALTACGTGQDARQAASDAASDSGPPAPAAVPRAGGVVSEPRSVADFTAVELAGFGTLTIDRTGTESLTIEAEDTVLPLLTSEVSDGVLRLGIKDNSVVTTTRPIVYRLTVKDLNGITVSGSGEVTAQNLDTGALTAVISGSGDVTVAGSANSQDVQITGSGDYGAGDLRSATAKVLIAGSGDVLVRVSDTLDAVISGSGDVVYIGGPTVTQDISGSGDIRGQ